MAGGMVRVVALRPVRLGAGRTLQPGQEAELPALAALDVIDSGRARLHGGQDCERSDLVLASQGRCRPPADSGPRRRWATSW